MYSETASRAGQFQRNLMAFMAFTDQEQREATEIDLSRNWRGWPKGKAFRCYLCGKKFEVGNLWRWVYSGKYHLINFLVCGSCDGDDVLDRWKEANEELKTKFWWILPHDY